MCENAGCVFAHFCGRYKNNFWLHFCSSFNVKDKNWTTLCPFVTTISSLNLSFLNALLSFLYKFANLGCCMSILLLCGLNESFKCVVVVCRGSSFASWFFNLASHWNDELHHPTLLDRNFQMFAVHFIPGNE